MSEPRGWPFLIGAGRRHEYRTLLAPPSLIAANEYGLLDRHATRTPPGEPRVVPVRPGLWMAYTTHPLTDRDEHNRPLQLLAGFVSEAPIDHLDASDLTTALDTALPVYRGYLDAEDTFAIAASVAFPLRSTVRPAPPPPSPPSAEPRRWTRTRTALAVAVAVVAVAVALAVVTLTGGQPQQICTPASPAVAPSAPACR